MFIIIFFHLKVGLKESAFDSTNHSSTRYVPLIISPLSSYMLSINALIFLSLAYESVIPRFDLQVLNNLGL